MVKIKTNLLFMLFVDKKKYIIFDKKIAWHNQLPQEGQKVFQIQLWMLGFASVVQECGSVKIQKQFKTLKLLLHVCIRSKFQILIFNYV